MTGTLICRFPFYSSFARLPGGYLPFTLFSLSFARIRLSCFHCTLVWKTFLFVCTWGFADWLFWNSKSSLIILFLVLTQSCVYCVSHFRFLFAIYLLIVFALHGVFFIAFQNSIAHLLTLHVLELAILVWSRLWAFSLLFPVLSLAPPLPERTAVVHLYIEKKVSWRYNFWCIWVWFSGCWLNYSVDRQWNEFSFFFSPLSAFFVRKLFSFFLYLLLNGHYFFSFSNYSDCPILLYFECVYF